MSAPLRKKEPVSVKSQLASERRQLMRGYWSIGAALFVVPFFAYITPLSLQKYHSLFGIMHAAMQILGVATVQHAPLVYPSPPYTLFSTKVVLPSHNIAPAYIHINIQGEIQSVGSTPLTPIFSRSRVIVDASPLVVMPGLIDPHVHVNAPGRESWEGFDSACRAAAAGGTTTILDMPLNNVPSTIDGEALAEKVQALESAHCIVDVGLIGGIIPSSIASIQELVDGGVIALKSFMVDSQSKEFPHVSKEDLVAAIAELDRIARSSKAQTFVPYILHAEVESVRKITAHATRLQHNHKRLTDYEATRPASWEIDAVKQALELANNSHVHVHIAHVSAHEVVELLSEVNKVGLNKMVLTAETCPHYLLWATESIPYGGTQFKCSPPIRSEANRQKLLKSIFRTFGIPGINLVASDHSPCPPHLKSLNGNVSEAWGGISGLQYRLQGTWTAGSTVETSIIKIVELLSEGPAQTFSLDGKKGFLRKGLDADIVVWDPEASTNLNMKSCQHRHKFSAFHDMQVRGVVFHTLLRGKPAYSRNGKKNIGRSDFGDNKGSLLIRSSTGDGLKSVHPNEWRS